MDSCAGYAVAAVADIPDTPSGDADALAGGAASTAVCACARLPSIACACVRFASTACAATPDGVCDALSGDAGASRGGAASTALCGRVRFFSTTRAVTPDGVCDALSVFASERVSVKTTGSFNVATSFDASGGGDCVSGFATVKRMASEIVRSVGGAEMRRSRSSEIALSGERFKTISGRGASSGGLS